jgi:DNA-binding NarL/FixJ family response regulator
VITLVIGEFPDLIAYGLRALLRDDERCEILATDVPMDGIEAAIAEVEPDVAILDFGALRSPIQVHQLHEVQPETHLVIVVDRATPQECNQLLAFGATAILARETQKRDILTAIHLASRGMHVLPGAGGAVSEEPYGPDLLTQREADVLELLQANNSNAEIAQKLHIGVETVRTHARNIYRKLGVTSRRDLTGTPFTQRR